MTGSHLRASGVLKSSTFPFHSLFASLSPILVLLALGRPDTSILRIAFAQIATIFFVQSLSFGSWIRKSKHKVKIRVEPRNGQEDTSAKESHKLADASIPQTSIQQEHPVYTNKRIDACLANFLAVVDPEQLQYLPDSEPTVMKTKLSAWDVQLQTDSITVCRHPSVPHLYAMSMALPGVPIRHAWEVLTDLDQRTSWDSMCSSSSDVESLSGPIRDANVIHLATKGKFPVKPTDMVMLAVSARLPGRTLQLVRALTSVEHVAMPPLSGHNRIELSIAGFVLSDDDNSGCKMTQVSDLSSIGSWLPARLMTTITQSVAPRTLMRFRDVVLRLQVPAARAALTGDKWIPPTLGSWQGANRTATETRAATLIDAGLTIQSLSQQMELVSRRIGQLENSFRSTATDSKDGRISKTPRFGLRNVIRAIYGTVFSTGGAATISAIFVVAWLRALQRTRERSRFR